MNDNATVIGYCLDNRSLFVLYHFLCFIIIIIIILVESQFRQILRGPGIEGFLSEKKDFVGNA